MSLLSSEQRTCDRSIGTPKSCLFPVRGSKHGAALPPRSSTAAFPYWRAVSAPCPEAVGPGGILIDPTAPAQIWAEELKRIWHDKDLYEELSAAATEYSERPQIDPDRQIEALLSVLRDVTGEGLTSC